MSSTTGPEPETGTSTAGPIEAQIKLLQLLEGVAQAAARGDCLEDALRPAVENICSIFGWAAGHLYLRSQDDPEELVSRGGFWCEDSASFRKLSKEISGLRLKARESLAGRAVQMRRSVSAVPAESILPGVSTETAEDCGISSVIAVPVTTGPRAVAVLEFFSKGESGPDPPIMELLNKLGGQLGRIVERELWDRKLTDAARHEQSRLAGELHDGVAQELTGIKLLSKGLLGDLEKAGSRRALKDPEIHEGLDRTLKKIRAMIEGMTAIEVQPDGLADALDKLAQRTETRYGIACSLTCDQPVLVETGETATHLLRIAQEAVQNAVKHSNAEHISISLRKQDDSVVVEVADDGVGLKRKPKPSSMGLRFMRYRAERIGATLGIATGDPGGTRVRCTLKEERRIG